MFLVIRNCRLVPPGYSQRRPFPLCGADAPVHYPVGMPKGRLSKLEKAFLTKLKQRLRAMAPGLTPRATLEKFSVMQMVDVYLPTTDGRTLVLGRYIEPEKDQQLLLQQLSLQLPEQPPPQITSAFSAQTA